jgi:hypothetical protein
MRKRNSALRLECPMDTRPIAPDRHDDAGKKVRLMTLGDLDGRTNAAKTARALIAELESDLGGADRLTACERVLAHRAAVATAMLKNMEARWLSGRGLDVASCATLTNALSTRRQGQYRPRAGSP